MGGEKPKIDIPRIIPKAIRRVAEKTKDFMAKTTRDTNWKSESNRTQSMKTLVVFRDHENTGISFIKPLKDVSLSDMQDDKKHQQISQGA